MARSTPPHPSIATSALGVLCALVVGCGGGGRQAPAAPAAGPDSAAGGEPALIERLDVIDDARKTIVYLSANEPLSWWIRLVDETVELTLDNAVRGSGVTGTEGRSGAVQAIRVEERRSGSSPTTTISIDLRTPVRYSVHTEGNALWVDLWPEASAVEAQVSSPDATSRDYVIGPSDLVDIDVPGLAELSGEVRVLPDGYIVLPVLGPVSIGGLTVEAAKAEIERALIDEGLLASPDAPASRAYTIGPGDLLDVDVAGVAELSRELKVLPDGRIVLPVLGPVSIGGLTVEATEAEIERALIDGDLMVSPQVSVVILQAGSRQVSVQGAVARPGSYSVTGSQTLLELLSRAGGLADSFDRSRDILVLRRDRSGAERKITVDYATLFESGDPSMNPILRADDLVLVPRERRFRVQVTGAVRSPGTIEFSSSRGLTVLQAITAAGGAMERARLGKVRIVRRAPDGTQTTIDVDLEKIRRGKVPDVPLEDDDTVFVPEWFF